VAKKFLLYNATLSSPLVKHLSIVVKTRWLTKHSTVDYCCLVNQAYYTSDSCVGKCNTLSYYSI